MKKRSLSAILALIMVLAMFPAVHGESTADLPLVSEPVTLTMFVSLNSGLVGITNDYAETPFFKELEARTGVHIAFNVPPTGEETTAYNLLIASGELPDLIFGAQKYPGGMDAAADDGYYLDLTPYLDTYLKDYKAVIDSRPEVAKEVKSDTGRVLGCYQVMTIPQSPYAGLMIRKDWLDELGLEIPVTYDDWEIVLTKFKEEKGAYAPLCLNATGSMTRSYAMSAGFNAIPDFMLVDGKVVYGATTQGWHDYLALMADWYEKGLIDPDFMTTKTEYVDNAMVISGQTGAFNAIYTLPSSLEGSVPGMELVGVTSPVVHEGDKLHIRINVGAGVSGPVAISADSKNAEVAMKWMNYLYTEEGALLKNFGLENDTFVYNSEGKPVFTDKIINNPEYTMNQAIALYTCPSARFGGLYDWTREQAGMAEKDIAMSDVWAVADGDYMLPTNLTYYPEESSERATIVTDIKTYMEEKTVQFITKVANLDEEWDTYVATIEGIGLQKAIEITQAAYDRYMSR